jgi:hypothetical protein
MTVIIVGRRIGVRRPVSGRAKVKVAYSRHCCRVDAAHHVFALHHYVKHVGIIGQGEVSQFAAYP